MKGFFVGVAACLAWAPCGAVEAQTRLDLLRGDSESRRFAQALEPRTFAFPRDHGPHPEFRHEWWYVTGHLESTGGRRFGFELTFFRYALAPPPAQATVQGASAWRANQVYMAHFAVTDLDRRQFHFDERLSREALGLAGAQAADGAGSLFRVWLDDWVLEAAPEGWSLRAAAKGYSLDLRLQPQVAEVLNGEAGLSRKSAVAGAASYYYSVPRIAASGRLTRDGSSFDVQGAAWLDREWGSGSLAANQAGWDWYALQLDDGSNLMFYTVRRKDGTSDPFSAGTWVGRDGAIRHLGESDVHIEVLDHWSSPRGGRYPARWRLHVPVLALDLTVRPLLPDQELLTRPRYWEGAVEVSGRQESRAATGRGYVELVGYAASR